MRPYYIKGWRNFDGKIYFELEDQITGIEPSYMWVEFDDSSGFLISPHGEIEVHHDGSGNIISPFENLDG